MSFRPLRAAALLLAGALSAPAVLADDFSVYLDSDRDPATGCTVTVLGGQQLAGIEFEVNATVTRPPATVASVSRAECQDPATGAFGPPTALPAGIPVGSNLGVDASDVVEFDAPLADLGVSPGTTVNLFVTATDGRSGFAQVSQPGYVIPGAPPTTPGGPVAVPALSLLGLLVLAALLAALGWRYGRRRPWLLGLAVLMLPGVARLAVPHLSDGLVDDWQGETPTATSPRGDSATPETDIRQLFVAEENGRLYFRIDVTELETATSPVAAITVDNPHPKVGARVILHGAGSDPVSGTQLHFDWTLDQAPAGSTVAIGDPAAADQSFAPDQPGDYGFSLVVTNSGGASSTPATVTVTATAIAANALPHAVIDAPGDVAVGAFVKLSGAGSTDADLDPLTYAWTLVAKPTGSSAAIAGPAKAKTGFTADLPGDYVVELVVNDGTSDSNPARATITAHPASVNAPPTVDAGPDQHVLVGQQVELRQTSSDPDGDTVTLTWRVVTRPDPASTAQVIQIPRSPKAELHYVFTPDAAGDFVIELVGTDPAGNVATDRVRVIADPPAATPHPIAEAGTDQTVKVGDTVTLDGRQSYDADGPATLAYQWSLTSAPAGSTAALVNPASATPTFVPDLAGDYVFQLVAVEGGVNSAPDSVTVTASPATTSLYQQLLDLGLDATDAHYLEANHAAEAQAVLAKTDRIFQGFALTDPMFGTSASPGAPSFAGVCPGTNFIPWTDDAKRQFQKIFGRLNFVINTSRFQQAFDAQANLLDPAYQDQPPTWRPYPANYAEFKAAVADALSSGGDALELFLCTNTNGTAYGVPPLRLMVDEQMMGKTVVTPGGVGAGWKANGAAPLVFHELTHSFGYAHDAGAQTDLVGGKPNNVPYFVQIMLGYDADDMLNGYCGGSVATCSRFFVANTDPANKGLLTAYFGTD